MPSALPAWNAILRDRRLYWLILLCAATLTLAYQRSEPFQLELGTHRDDALLEGFYGPEGRAPNAVRWTGARADVRLPNLWPAQPVLLTLVLNAPRPEAGASVPVTLTVNGRTLAPRLSVGPNVSLYMFELDAASMGASGNLYLTLQAPTFTPRNDTRELGIMLSRLEVTPEASAPYLPAIPVVPALTLSVALAYVWLLRLGATNKAAFAAGTGLALACAAALLLDRPVLALYNLQSLYILAVALAASELTVRLGRFQFDRRACRWTALLFLSAFALRMVLAHSAGDPGNFAAFKLMIAQVAAKGVAHIYELDPVVGAYPPVHHYDWELISFVYRTFMSPDFNLDSVRLNFIMKMPTITLDMLITSVIMVYASRQRDARAALLAGAAYALNPGIIYATAWNGQLGDPIYALWVTLAVVALLNGRAASFGAAAALALLTKPQASAFLPLFAIAALRYLPRSVMEQSASAPTDASPGSARASMPALQERSRLKPAESGIAPPTGEYLPPNQDAPELAEPAVGAGANALAADSPIGPFVSTQNVRLWARVLLGSAAATLLVLAPFVLAGTLGQMVNTVATTIGHGPRLSSNAYNLWWLASWGRAWDIEDTELLFGLVSYRIIGLVLLFVIANGLLVWKGWRAASPRALLVLAVFAGLAFFVLPTEIHENYLFPTIPLLALATVQLSGTWKVWAILSATWFFNLIFVDIDLTDALTTALPWFAGLIFPIQVVACVLNIGVLVAWTRKVVAIEGIRSEGQNQVLTTKTRRHEEVDG